MFSGVAEGCCRVVVIGCLEMRRGITPGMIVVAAQGVITEL